MCPIWIENKWSKAELRSTFNDNISHNLLQILTSAFPRKPGQFIKDDLPWWNDQIFWNSKEILFIRPVYFRIQ